MRISVVIPTLDDESLAQAIDAVLRQERRADEILVVGIDGKGVTKAYPQVRFVDTGRPVCAAAARNLGIRLSTGSIIAFTDADCIPTRRWLACHEAAHAAGFPVVGGSVALAGANYLAQGDNVALFHAAIRQHPRGERFALPTLNLSIDRSVVERVGYLDESFPGAAGEDTDWTLRMRLAGYPLRFEPSAVVRHAPCRTRWAEVLRHWTCAGHAGIRVRQRYAPTYGTPRWTRSAGLLRALSPLIALYVTLRIYRQPRLWRYLAYLPIVYLAKVAYCLGAAAAVASGFAFTPDRTDPGEAEARGAAQAKDRERRAVIGS